MQQACHKSSGGKGPVRFSRLWVPVFMMAGISILSGSPGVQAPGWSFVGIDKLAHLLVFGLLGISWARVLHGPFFPDRKRLLTAVLLTTLFGLLDELHQLQNPLRTFEWADLLADFAGALILTGLYLNSRRLQSLMELEIRQVPRLILPGKPPN